MPSNDEFTTFFAVWTKPVRGEGSWRPMRRTWDNYEDAEVACRQMAEKHPGKKFFVMQAVSRAVIHEPADDLS